MKKVGGQTVKGTQKRVIHLKNTESSIFEEAYFIVKEGARESYALPDMISEANRIIEENVSDAAELGAKKGSGRLYFVLAALVAATVTVGVTVVLLL